LAIAGERRDDVSDDEENEVRETEPETDEDAGVDSEDGSVATAASAAVSAAEGFGFEDGASFLRVSNEGNWKCMRLLLLGEGTGEAAGDPPPKPRGWIEAYEDGSCELAGVVGTGGRGWKWITREEGFVELLLDSSEVKE